MATNFEPQEYVTFVQPTKIGTHENKAINSNFLPWSLTYFWKTLTLAITLKPEVIGLSYCTCVFLVTRPFTLYYNVQCIMFLPWPWILTYFWKTITLAITFKQRYGFYITHVYFLWQDLSHGKIIFYLDLKFDPIVKNINLGCYLVMVAARRASLSSDNTYFKVGQPVRSRSIRQQEPPVWRRFLKKGTPVTYFCPALDTPLGGSGRKTTTLVRDHEYFIPTKFHQNPSSGSGEKVENVKVYRRMDGRRTDGALWQ